MAFSFFIALNIVGAYGPSARVLAWVGGYLVIAFVQANVLLVGFLLLAVLGLA